MGELGESLEVGATRARKKNFRDLDWGKNKINGGDM
jgi:hypothetical protein